MSAVSGRWRCLRAWWPGSKCGNSDWQLVIPVIRTVHFNINIFGYFFVLNKYLLCQVA